MICPSKYMMMNPYYSSYLPRFDAVFDVLLTVSI
jgi:hypothetical protein